MLFNWPVSYNFICCYFALMKIISPGNSEMFLIKVSPRFRGSLTFVCIARPGIYFKTLDDIFVYLSILSLCIIHSNIYYVFDGCERPCLLPFSEMVKEMKKVVNAGEPLTVEERNLLSVAFKNVIGARRASWRVLSSVEKNQEESHDEKSPNKLQSIKEYRQKVEKELREICEDILKLLDKTLVPMAVDTESKVFYNKM